MIPGFLTLLACAGLVWSGLQASQAWMAWRAGPAELPRAEVAMTAPDTATPASEGVDTRPWLPIFGVPRQDLRQQVARQATGVDYALKGVVASGNMRWAILTGAGRDLLVREGDVLQDGTEIVTIHAEGLDITLDGALVSLGFAEDAPVAVQRLTPDPAPPATASADQPTMLPPASATEGIFQNLSTDQVLAILRKAEAQRREKGIILDSK